ncbi:hypothetical protein QTP70_034029 [Hemibagrus guttatus]|uniref:Phosphatidic acid phosphatase type 2/haloperoxidase domain-containing protein n=1 Tax=Hemibagrus guttatus TaxID=175788 RepID=A0AAE0RH75_9TELE|nr:hypothetical protein QTP70_034029 [Hemibagrus guttatus]
MPVCRISMGSALRTELTWLLSSLHDPRYVARFQELCGVRGTFTGNGEKMDADQRKRPSREGKGKHQDVNGTANGTANGAVGESARTCPSSGSAKYGTARGPLRRNSLTGDVGHQFAISNRFLYYAFTLGTELGNEMFYISFFPFLTWNVDPFVARRLIAIWVWVMYLGQCTKDLVRWPRPASPPVVKLEVFYDSEYSMPSTHAMSGTAVPLGIFLLTCSRWEYPFLLGLTLALSWSVLVCVSRVYMGMHSVLDVIVGFFYSLLILVVFYPALDAIDTFNLSSRYAPILVVSFHAMLGLFSFTLDTWSTSRGDTAQILGTGAGIAVASHLNYQLALIHDPPASMLPLQAPPLSLGLLGWSLLRFILGVMMLIVTRAVMKALTIPLVCRVVGIPSGDVRKARQNMQVELPYRYIVYWAVGFSAFFLIPFIFSCIGLY